MSFMSATALGEHMATVRLMTTLDLPLIMVMETQYQIHPWEKTAFEQALRLGQYCCVAEEDGQLVAYGVAHKGHGRTICAASLQGADAVYHAWFDHARSCGANELYAEIEGTNRAARIRLKRYGFELAGVRPAFYGPGHDAEVWTRATPALAGATPQIAPVQDVTVPAENA